jgi:hypothetical protein
LLCLCVGFAAGEQSELFCEIQVVALAAEAPATEPSTPANTVTRFASTLLMKRWLRC